jgi:fibronectin-binding autotransporter adhesin
VDPATTPGAIKVIVDHVPANKLWVGGAVSAPNTWDINTTTNWFNQSTSTPGAVFTAGDTATFNDSATTNVVNLVGSINTINVVMLNFGTDYTFTGPGSLTGAGGLTLNGFGNVIIANAGSNTLSGPTAISFGALVIGDGGTNGNLGPGAISSSATLAFNRSDAGLTVPNTITGNGSINNLGPGTVTLSGNNSGFSGSDNIMQGTLRVTTSTALGDPNGTTLTIANGATLDVTANTVNLGNLPISVSGSGVGNNGAIVNNGHNTAGGTPNMANVTMQGDTTFGGNGRLDLRSPSLSVNSAVLNAQSAPYTLTKTGTNQFWMSAVNVDAALGNIIVTNGLLGIEAGTTLGNASYSVTVCSNATLEFLNLSNVLSKNLALKDGSTLISGGGSNVYSGPIVLAGTNTINVSAGNLALGSGGISGSSGGLIKGGGAVLSLSAIPASGVFDLTGGTLDITNAGGILNLGAGQTIRGSATLGGTLNAGIGSVVSPGETATIGTLTCASGATLNGASLLKLNKSVAPSNDVLNVRGTLTYGGTLTVTNLGPLTAGDNFRLFNATGYTGNFTATNLPATATWNWNPSTGTLTVLTVVSGGPGIFTNTPGITAFSLNGANIVITGTNGQSGDAYYLLQSTNLTQPFSQWTTVGTNVPGSNGLFTATYTNVVTPGPRQFFILSNTNLNH